jgi:hypothetical protein
MSSLNGRIGEAHPQLERPPVDSWLAAYPHVLTLARTMLSNEIKRKAKREAVLKEFDARVARIDERLNQCKTLGEQILSLRGVYEGANPAALDLRSSREGRGPDDESLLKEYDLAYQQVRKIFGRFADRKRAKLVERLQIVFPKLKSKQASKAACSKPSWATCIVIGAHFARSPSRIRDLRTETRRRRAREPKDR